VNLAARIALFRRLPKGTVLTVLLRRRTPGLLVDELDGEVRCTSVVGRLLGVADVHLACPKVRLQKADGSVTVLHLTEVVTIRDVQIPASAGTDVRGSLSSCATSSSRPVEVAPMNEGLRGINAELRALAQEQKSITEGAQVRIRQIETERDEKIAALHDRKTALESAKALLNGDADAARERAKEQTNARARKRAAAKNGNGKTDSAATAMQEALRAHGNGGMSEKALGEAAGLHGRGSHNTRQAAIRSLLAANVIVEKPDPRQAGDEVVYDLVQKA
jgi:hypothetical protein